MKRIGIIIVMIVTIVMYAAIKERIPITASSTENQDEMKIQLQGLFHHEVEASLDYEIWFKADKDQIANLNQGMYFMNDLPLGIYEIIIMNNKSMRATGEIQFIYEKGRKLSTVLQKNCNRVYIGDMTKSIRLDLSIDLRGEICINSLEYVQGGVRDLRKRLDPNNIMIDLLVTFLILMIIFLIVKKTSYTFWIKGMEEKG